MRNFECFEFWYGEFECDELWCCELWCGEFDDGEFFSSLNFAVCVYFNVSNFIVGKHSSGKISKTLKAERQMILSQSERGLESSCAQCDLCSRSLIWN